MPEIIVILSNIRSCHNVGSILRTADGFGTGQVFICGYTPYPKAADDPRLPHLADKITRDIHKTALGAELTMPIRLFKDTLEAIKVAKSQGYTIAALEQSQSSTPLHHYSPPKKVALILGNEVDGLAIETLKASDVIIEIPMRGKKESFNVSISAAITLFALNYHKKA